MSEEITTTPSSETSQVAVISRTRDILRFPIVTVACYVVAAMSASMSQWMAGIGAEGWSKIFPHGPDYQIVFGANLILSSGILALRGLLNGDLSGSNVKKPATSTQ